KEISKHQSHATVDCDAAQELAIGQSSKNGSSGGENQRGGPERPGQSIGQPFRGARDCHSNQTNANSLRLARPVLRFGCVRRLPEGLTAQWLARNGWHYAGVGVKGSERISPEIIGEK